MQQAVGWRESAAAARPSPHQRFVGDNSETYGYVDRFPTAERTNHQLVFGVPHRFTENYPSPYESLLSAAASDYDTYDNGQYFVPAAYYRPPEPELNKRAMRYSPYDLMEEDNDIGQNDYQVVGPSQEDVLNFQKYIQRYFHPTKAERIVNNGYDDADGYYRISKNDQIGFRFQIIEQIGKGAFGQVLKCFDHKTKQMVAMKLVKN